MVRGVEDGDLIPPMLLDISVVIIVHLFCFVLFCFVLFCFTVSLVSCQVSFMWDTVEPL